MQEAAMCHKLKSPRVNTTHGKKKNQGMLAIVNNRVSLCFTEGQEEKITGYTPIEDIMTASCMVYMKIHYFQRYHEKENVATANTMLLLSRLYSYSSDKFFRFLKSEYFSDSFNPEIIFTLQEKSVDSIPDATITQESFKIVVETKMSDWFYEDQLLRHLNSFGDEKYKVMITLAPEIMEENKKAAFEKKLKEYNDKQHHPVIHINYFLQFHLQPQDRLLRFYHQY